MLTASGRKTFRSLHPAWECLNYPSAEPMSIVEAKLQCRRATDETSQDLLWRRIVEASRDRVEADLSRAICWQRWKLILDEWPDVIDIYKCPVRAVESVKYYDYSGTLTTVASTVYKVSYSEPARINLAFAQSWEPSIPQMGAIEVTFTAGYLVPFTANSSTDVLTFIDYTPTNGDYFTLTNSGGELPSPLVEKRRYYIVGASGSTCQLSLTAGGAAINLTSTGYGLHYLGEVRQSIMEAMRKRVAVEYADAEGSEIAAKCEASYLQSLRAAKYTVM